LDCTKIVQRENSVGLPRFLCSWVILGACQEGEIERERNPPRDSMAFALTE
jgi:hypothetical protein